MLRRALLQPPKTILLGLIGDRIKGNLFSISLQRLSDNFQFFPRLSEVEARIEPAE